MGLFDIVHFTEASLENKDDEPSVWACFGFYPKDVTYTQLVYDAVMYGEHLPKPKKAIVKFRRFRAGTEQFWEPRLDSNTHAAGVASAFTEKTGAGKISFVQQYLAPLKGYSRWDKICRSMKQYDFRDFKKDEIVLIEPLLSDTMVFFEGDIILDAFSHFSFIEGNHQSVIAIFKGVKSGNEYHLLTPKILQKQKEINEFFDDHACNDLCVGWSKPDVKITTDTPLFHIPASSEHLKLQRQTSVRVHEPGEHASQIKIPHRSPGILRNPSAPPQEQSFASSKKKVTTIMHAVYVHEDPKQDERGRRGSVLKNDEKVRRGSLKKQDEKERRGSIKRTSAPYVDNAIRKDRSDSHVHVLKRTNTEHSSPSTKNKPVRVHTMDVQNVRMPKKMNAQSTEKPEIKPKPEIKQKPEVKPKPEIKPKPKLKKQERIDNENDTGTDDKYGVHKMAVQDELRLRFSRIANKEKQDPKLKLHEKQTQETKSVQNLPDRLPKVVNKEQMFPKSNLSDRPSEQTNDTPESQPEKVILVPHLDKNELEHRSDKQDLPNTSLREPSIHVNPPDIAAAESPKCNDSVSEIKVKSKKSLRKQATLAS